MRSALFVPANRRAWIEKVHEYCADAVVLDLEDATPPGHKAQARAIVRDVLPLLQGQDQGVWIRVNAIGSEHLDEDLDTACRDGVDLICLPKVSGPGDVAELDRLIGYHEGRNGLPHGTLGIYPLLETAQGIADARAVFAASSRVRYGGAVTGANADVQFAIGYRWTQTFTETLHLRSAVLLAARAAGIENPVTGLVTALDADLARRFAEQSRDLGYAGMFVHPPEPRGGGEHGLRADRRRARLEPGDPRRLRARPRLRSRRGAGLPGSARRLRHDPRRRADRRAARPLHGARWRRQRGMTDAGALSDLRVLDLGHVIAGPFAATLLGDLGADVVKIEHPVRGDTIRALGPQHEGVPLWWKVAGRNKRSLTLDLSKEAGRDVLLALVAVADVLVENFRPGRSSAGRSAPTSCGRATRGSSSSGSRATARAPPAAGAPASAGSARR